MKHIITHWKQLEEFRHLSGKYLAVDTETGSDDKLLTVQVAWSPVDAMCIWVDKCDAEAIRIFLSNSPLVMHYGQHDVTELAKLGIRATVAFDTYAAARLLFYDKREGFGLKYLARTYLGMEMKDLKDIAGEDYKTEDVDPAILADYGMDDALATYRLFT